MLETIRTMLGGAPVRCPLCSAPAQDFGSVDGVSFHLCADCDFIFADPAFLARVDAGESVRKYDASYWAGELAAARARSFGSSLARCAEAVLYCRIPVERFVDVGSGPGFLLDALSTYLPAHRSRFFGVERFPPDPPSCTQHENYLFADLGDVDLQFECGVCIEVFEHLTPAMAAGLARSLHRVSVPGSLFLFNTGLTDFVKHEDASYLDPLGRGHITSWSITAARRIFEPVGFHVHALPGKTWAFVVERPRAGAAFDGGIRDRIWHAPARNRELLTDPVMGEVMYLLGLESARAYG
jgi:hypothetical protein